MSGSTHRHPPELALVRPGTETLPGFLTALEHGWSPNTEHVGIDQELIDRVTADPQLYLELAEDPQARGPRITMPDGSTVPRLPGLTRWMWADGFVGSIGLRWAAGTTDLPPTCLGHVGYAVVPWARRQGYATAALAQMLPIAAEVGLPWVDLVTDLDNEPSQRVIRANGGRLLGQYQAPAQHGGRDLLSFRIELA